MEPQSLADELELRKELWSPLGVRVCAFASPLDVGLP